MTNRVVELFSSYDRIAENFGPIFPADNAGVAIRAWTDALLSDQPSDMSQHPDHFELYHLGSYDHATGAIGGLSKLGKPLITGTQVISSTKKAKKA